MNEMKPKKEVFYRGVLKNEALLLLISSSCFLIFHFLVASMIYEEQYCKLQIEWLSEPVTLIDSSTFTLWQHISKANSHWSLIKCDRLESQLMEDIFFFYNRLPRPIKNASEAITIKFGASLIRIIDVDEKNQVLTTNLWLELQWNDYKLQWDPSLYGGISKLHIPIDYLWTPDVVLYNNAAGNPDITILSDAILYFDGTVSWKPPAIYKSFCSIDVTWFPYDIQDCDMKFGLWSYTGNYVDLKQLPEENVQIIEDNDGSLVEFLDVGMDLSYFYRSAEWDLLKLTSKRHEVIYNSCCGPAKYVDITFYMELRRKTLFYTCNLITPCFLISIMTGMVFYTSDHKITFAISILVSLFFFFLILIDIIPPTSLVIPMFGKYLLVTMIAVTLSTMISVVTVNFHLRSGTTHRMPAWVQLVFLEILPKILFMERPKQLLVIEADDVGATIADIPDTVPREEPQFCSDDSQASSLKPPTFARQRAKSIASIGISQRLGPPPPILAQLTLETSPCIPRKKRESKDERLLRVQKQMIHRILSHVRFIADHFRQQQEIEEISHDWTFVALVIDRLFLVIFSLLNVATLGIILRAPTLYDTRQPIVIPSASRPLGQDTLGIVQ